jgi:hypothetical protein
MVIILSTIRIKDSLKLFVFEIELLFSFRVGTNLFQCDLLPRRDVSPFGPVIGRAKGIDRTFHSRTIFHRIVGHRSSIGLLDLTEYDLTY